MSRENQTGFLRVTESREQIRLLAGRIVSQASHGTEAAQIVADPFDQPKVRVARPGIEPDQPLDHGAGRRTGTFCAHNSLSRSKTYCTSAVARPAAAIKPDCCPAAIL